MQKLLSYIIYIFQAASKLAVLLVLLVAGLGYFVGFTSTAPFFTAEFRQGLLVAFLLAVGLLTGGAILSSKAKGKAMQALGTLMLLAGLLVWCVTGLMGFGPA